MTRRISWALLAILVLAQICYPLTTGAHQGRAHRGHRRARGGCSRSAYALLSRGPRMAAALVAVATGGGFAIEAIGVAHRGAVRQLRLLRRAGPQTGRAIRDG